MVLFCGHSNGKTQHLGCCPLAFQSCFISHIVCYKKPLERSGYLRKLLLSLQRRQTEEAANPHYHHYWLVWTYKVENSLGDP